MNYLVGDVQGCDSALGALLAQVGFSPSRDRVFLLGDLVNRGPASLAVLERLSAFGNAAGCVLGNHDLHLLAVASGGRPMQRGDTFADVLAGPAAAGWTDWLRAQPLAAEECGWLCVHAGVVPQWNRQAVLAHAAEVEDVLRGPGACDFLQVLYSNEPARWSERLQGTERWRFIINVFTRIRFCSADGTLDYKTKEGAGAAPADKMPWFDVPGRLTEGEPIAFGHWSTLGLIDRPDLLALDTGCVWGGRLSAMRVDGGRRELHQVQCPQAQVPGRAAE